MVSEAKPARPFVAQAALVRCFSPRHRPAVGAFKSRRCCLRPWQDGTSRGAAAAPAAPSATAATEWLPWPKILCHGGQLTVRTVLQETISASFETIPKRYRPQKA